MTLQEMFDTAARGIISQGGKSADEDGACLYRGPGGRRCAVGWLIPDDVAAESEGNDAIYLTGNYPDLFDTAGWGLAVSMQVAHDDSDNFAPGREWSLRMRDIAADLGLSTAVLDAWESEATHG